MRTPHSAGVTLIEMLVVVALIGLLAGVSLPAVNAGVDSLRLASAADAVASFLNAALNRAERRQQVMEIVISRDPATLTLRSAEPGFARHLALPEGVTIVAIQPQADAIYLYPGGAIPRIVLTLVNRRGAKRLVRIDPATGVPDISTPAEDAQ